MLGFIGMNILCIDTTTSVCSVSLCAGKEVLFHRINLEEHQHAKLLPLFAQEALTWLDQQGLTLDAVAVSQGPGSYTGLRIGVATAKGLAYGHQVPLIAVDTLQLIAASAALTHTDGLICPMIDARRMEVYDAIYSPELTTIREVAATIVEPSTYLQWLEKGPIYFCGDGAAKTEPIIQHPNARYLTGIVPDARFMGALANNKLTNNQTEDIAYFEPFYLKEWTTK